LLAGTPLALLLGILLWAGPPAGRAGAQPAASRFLVFYDPNANHQAILNITSRFNRFLKDAAPSLRFQPVQKRAQFEALLADPRTVLAIVASSYLEEGARTDLTPVLVPSARGDVYFRKRLVDRGKGKPGDLRGKRVAAAATTSVQVDAAREVLRTLQAGGLDVTQVIAIPVAKDIDALLALSFGQVEAALVTPESIEVLKRINPSAAASFRTVFETSPRLRSPLCSVGARLPRPELDALVAALLQMHAHESGGAAVKILGFDRWVPFAAGMLK
jgi:ABC-type phosphate/phosphonate transport system substrate-binding protein